MAQSETAAIESSGTDRCIGFDYLVNLHETDINLSERDIYADQPVGVSSDQSDRVRSRNLDTCCEEYETVRSEVIHGSPNCNTDRYSRKSEYADSDNGRFIGAIKR